MFVIMSVCLIASPATCKEARVQQTVEERPPIACIVEGQSTVAVWQSQHPAYVVKRWKCVPRSRLEQPL